MSAYVAGETQYKDEECLVKSLEEMGYVVERHKNGANLRGYMGDLRSQRAHVIIRKQYVGGASNDVGFERMPDGTFRSHISEFDQRHHFGPAVQLKLKKTYAQMKTTAIFQAKGYTVTKPTVVVTNTGQRVQLFAKRWRA